MTVKIGNQIYRNITMIQDMQSRKIAVVLITNSWEQIEIPVTENDEIIFILEGQDVRKGN